MKEINTKQIVEEWKEEYNLSNQHRQISNVKILDSQCLGYIHI